MAPFSMTLNDPGFKVTPFFDAEYLRNGTRYKHSFNGILIGTYTRPTLRRCVQIRLLTYLLTQQCHFE